MPMYSNCSTLLDSSTCFIYNPSIVVTSSSLVHTRIVSNTHNITTPSLIRTSTISNYSNYSGGTATTASGIYIAGNTYIIPMYNDTYSDIIIPEYMPPKRDIKNEIRIRDKSRNIVKKSLRLFQNFFGVQQAKLFLSGETIVITGGKFDYYLTKRKYGGLVEQAQKPNNYCIPYKLEIVNKQGLVLCSGCTFFKDTPILDQIVAILLHIQDNEENVLINMNLSNFTKHFYDDEESIQYLENVKNKQYRLR